jgi:hypothetical protein
MHRAKSQRDHPKGCRQAVSMAVCWLLVNSPGCLRGEIFHGIYGELRTDNLAIMAVDAPLIIGHLRRMIAFLVKSRGKGQYISGTKLNAVPAAFAPVFNDMNRTLDDFNCFGIKRNPPEIHDSIPFLR